MVKLAGRVALITGAASGIGRATAKLLAAEGARVAVCDIREEGAAQTAEAIIAEGGSAISFRLDVSKERDWETVTSAVLERFEKVNIVCNIAGIGAMADIETVTVEHWDREISVNLTGVMLGCKYGVSNIKQSGEPGAIVNLGSISALRGIASQIPYCASKAGVRTLTKAVALHCAEKGYPIRCNAIHPTYVDTGIADPFVQHFESREAMLATFAKDVPIGRVAQPEEIAKVVLFLVSDDSAMMTAAELVVDGGHTSRLSSSFAG